MASDVLARLERLFDEGDVDGSAALGPSELALVLHRFYKTGS